MSRLKTGGYAPLFDRLAQVEDGKRGVAHWLDIKQLERSVFKELVRIVQTRSRLTFPEFLNKNYLTVLDYGLPDFYGRSVQNSDNRNEIHQILMKAFLSFEPRLKNIKIEHIVDSQSKGELKFQISGDLQTDQATEPVSFLISSESEFKDYSLEEQSIVG
jgi:type VI secretion system lysozyme-like protein